MVDPAVARTLPERDFRSGLAEIVKHGIVLDGAYFDEVERDVPAAGADPHGVRGAALHPTGCPHSQLGTEAVAALQQRVGPSRDRSGRGRQLQPQPVGQVPPLQRHAAAEP